MERKLATVLFVDLVDSSGLVSGADPEVARRRVSRFFDRASRCIHAHGGTVEKFAGDAVMAVFGVPRAHEDDAERALRAALSILDAVRDLSLEARIGVEAGEVVAEDGDSSFATGEAVHRAARLEAAARPNEILVGPGARGLARLAIELEPDGTRELRGLGKPLPVWRAVGIREREPGAARGIASPLVGRDSELDLLRNTFERAVRDRRAHLFTVFGDPGVGKSRLAREFVDALDGATVLAGRCLPYGEGITYWPLAEMVKAVAGIADDDPVTEAREKLVTCCEDEAVADLLGLAAGVLDAVEGERTQQEISWAAREWAQTLATAQPLVLVFEDVHWAEEPLLDLVEHLASWVREAPLLLLCLARPELLDVRPGWGGGRVRATAIELEPLGRSESEELVDALLERAELPGDVRAALLEKTEGNPLFVEETVRMLGEGGGSGIPDSLQALIAARIDRLPLPEKLLLQRAAVAGRIFWPGALAQLSPDLDDPDGALEGLLLRDLVLPETRSTITGEPAYRFKHVLIRDVAYAGLAKADRARHHAAFAAWLADRTGEELLEIRAYHLDQAATLLAELDGEAPAELRHEAAAALTEAGKRAFAREANRSARRLLLRAVELEPTLARRHLAAVAAWRLDELPAVAGEMERVAADAREEGDDRIRGRALSALANVALLRDGDLPRAQELAEEALALLEDDPAGRADALFMLGQMAWWRGDLTEYERRAREALELAHDAGLKHVESEAAQQLAQASTARLQLDEAERYVARATELAEASGSITARAQALGSRGMLLSLRGQGREGEQVLEQARTLYEEAGSAWPLARTLQALAWLAEGRRDLARAEKLFRESIRILKGLEDRGALCESQRGLAQLLVRLGRVEEAERVALESRRTVGPYDHTSRATTRLALAQVRMAQGREREAEELAREALEIVEGTDFVRAQVDVLRSVARYLRGTGRADEARAMRRRAADLVRAAGAQAPTVSTARID